MHTLAKANNLQLQRVSATFRRHWLCEADAQPQPELCVGRLERAARECADWCQARFRVVFQQSRVGGRWVARGPGQEVLEAAAAAVRRCKAATPAREMHGTHSVVLQRNFLFVGRYSHVAVTEKTAYAIVSLSGLLKESHWLRPLARWGTAGRRAITGQRVRRGAGRPGRRVARRRGPGPTGFMGRERAAGGA